MYKNSQYKLNRDVNECTSRGVCSLSPSIAAMQEILLQILKHISYYILKLENLGGDNRKLKISIINDIASLNIIGAINEKQLYSIIIKNYNLLINTEKTYTDYCKKNNILYKKLRFPIKFDTDYSLSNVISAGEKLHYSCNKKLPISQINTTEILFIIIKSICENLSQLSDFNDLNDMSFKRILRALNLFNKEKCTISELENIINKLSINNNFLRKKLAKNLFNRFGSISETLVSHSTRPGKAILVSGSNFLDLQNILEETKNKNIDVYTHSKLLIAHSLEKFKSYKNLIGHYGNSTESCILDYGTFPGAILLTKGEQNNNEYFYRGRLFSNDYFANSGIIQIENSDYSPIIDAAYNAKGFTNGKIKESTTIGFNEKDLISKFEQIRGKIENNDIKHLYFVGLNPHSQKQNEYFNSFFEHLEKNEFAISLYFKSKRKNVITVDIGNYTPLASYILWKFLAHKHITKNTTFIYTTCDAMAISGIITLNLLNINSVYISQCPPTLINPSVLKTFLEKYNVKITTNPIQDLNNMRINN